MSTKAKKHPMIETKPKCERTDKSGYIITSPQGTKTTADKREALRLYKSMSGRKTLSVCDAGYIIPILEEN